MKKFKVTRRGFLKATGALGVLALEEGQIGLLRHMGDLGEVLAAPAEEAEEKVTHSICVMDHRTCGLDVVSKNGKAVKIYGSKSGYGLARNRGHLCPKGNSGIAVALNPLRIRYPMKRVGDRGEGKWQRISYEEATDTIAAKLLEVKEKYGANAIVTGGWEAPKNWGTYASKFGMTSYSNTYYCTAMHARAQDLTGYPCNTHKGCDWENTDLMIMWGGEQNMYSDCPAMGNIGFLDARERGAKMVVIDPWFGIMASKADVFIPIKPGYDVALMLGMMNIIINENLYDANFIRDWTVGFDDLKEYVQGFSPEKVEQITGISADTIANLAREYATTPRACIWTSKSALGQRSTGVNVCRLQKILIGITGHIDVPGGNIVDMPNPALWPPSSALSTMTLSTMSSVSSSNLSPSGGGQVQAVQMAAEGELQYPLMGSTVTLPQFLSRLAKGEFKAACQFGNAGSGHNASFWKLYKQIPFIAACDLWMTPVAELADVIIPGSAFIESMACYAEGAYTPYYALRVTEPIPNPLTEMSDEDACFMLMKKLGLEKDYPYESWEDEVGKRFLQGTYKVPLTAKEMITQFPAGIVVPRAEMTYKKYEAGLIRKDKEPGFETTTGKFEIRSPLAEQYGYDPVPKWEVPWELREEERTDFPLILDTAERTWFYGCPGFPYINPLSAVPYLSEMNPEPYIRLNEKDAMERGIKDGDMVIVTSRISPTEKASIKLRAKIPAPHGDIMPGVCKALRGFAAANTADLIPDFSLPKAFGPEVGQPPIHGILVQVSKV